MRETQLKGDTATTQAIATFTRLGHDVSVPVTESASYDLVVDLNGQLKRVQCKWCGAKDWSVGLRKIHSNSTGYVVKRYERDSFDMLYVLRSDGEEFLFTQDLSGRNSIRVTKENDKLAVVLAR